MTDLDLLVEQRYAPVPGGLARYVNGLEAALRDTAAPQGTVRAWALRGQGAGDPGLHRVALGRRLAAAVWALGLGPAPRGGHVLHAPTLCVPPKRAPLVVTVHDVVPWTHPETLTRAGVLFHRRMGARVAREADLVVTPTDAVAEQVRAVIDPAAPVVPVPPGFTRLPATRTEHAEGAPYLLFVGTAEPRKGLDVLLDALRTPALDRASLVVVGPAGWGGIDVRAMACARGLEGRVRLAGAVSDDRLAELYAGATTLVLPSRAEGFGLPVLEAMALGVPVVTSDDPALCEVGAQATRRARVGDVDELAAVLAEVLDDQDLRRRMRAAGLRRAEDFDWTTTGRRMWELYREVAA